MTLRPQTLLAAAFAALLGAAGPSPATAATDPFQGCLAGLRADYAKRGLSAAAFDRATARVAPDLSILELLDKQPEFTAKPWDYIAPLVDEQRIADGQAMLAKWKDALAAAEKRSGVDRYTLVALWGVESDFGREMGSRPLVQSLATLSCMGRRQSYFRGEFFHALGIIARGDVRQERLVGSWAGAFGHTQFMPSELSRTGVDLDGDGRTDLIGSVPDALGSTANTLKSKGWSNAVPWGWEVRLPKGFETGLAGRTKRRTTDAWEKLGLRRADGKALPDGVRAGLILPAGAAGPAFLTTRGFDALFSYNPAALYALAIAHLSDRLRGGGPFLTPWPTDDRGLSRAERRELQVLLTRRGYDVGEPDGKIGPKTRAAITDLEAKLGREASGRPGGVVLDALRKAR